MSKTLRIQKEDLTYFKSLRPDIQQLMAAKFYDLILELAEAMHDYDNLYLTIGRTRRRDQYAIVLHSSDLIYGSYHPSMVSVIEGFRTKVERWRDGEADDFGRWPDRREDECRDGTHVNLDIEDSEGQEDYQVDF